eukprot:scaffold123188_cov15-Tisochrysis_lutea.AAC.1
MGDLSSPPVAMNYLSSSPVTRKSKPKVWMVSLSCELWVPHKSSHKSSGEKIRFRSGTPRGPNCSPYPPALRHPSVGIALNASIEIQLVPVAHLLSTQGSTFSHANQGTQLIVSMRLLFTNVEDMMKRSFSEWRAQRAAPAATAQLQAVDEGLARLARTPWPATYLGCTSVLVCPPCFFLVAADLSISTSPACCPVDGRRSRNCLACWLANLN